MQVKLQSVNMKGDQLRVLREWCNFLIDRFGYLNSQLIIYKYESFGWISGSVKKQMIDILSDLRGSANHTSYTEPNIDWEPLRTLKGTEFEVHAYSLAYISKIKKQKDM